MSVADPTIHELRAAMRRALEPVFECLDDMTDDIADALEDAIDGLPEAITFAVANPCACARGRACPYRGLPPGDPDTGHCQQCGAYMPTTLVCPECGAEYVGDEDEEAPHG